ncbi:MAG TPA: hypothetical protein VJP45_09490 [Candidatus Limnocylindria bacterium]|nr:hypothetical protein [Candidatus Limnocylindria bacterium]
MPDAATIRPLVWVSVAALAVRIASAFVVAQPGYTDAYYYTLVASRLAHGDGLSADFIWNFIEAPRLEALPVASHRFWVPLATTLQAGGIALLGGLLGEFRAAQAAVIAVAAALPAVTYAAARSLGVSTGYALGAASVVGLGGVFAPGLVAADSFAPAALIGTLFFIAFARAALGSTAAGALAGLLVGLLYLARAEGALFGLALLALAARPVSRRPGLLGSAIALAIGGAWLARDLSLGGGDLLARSMLLVRYEDFFRIESPTLAAFSAALTGVLAAKAGAVASNAVTAVFAFAVLLGPLAALAARRLRARADVRAWSALLVLVFLAQSLLFTLHSTRGSYFHSLAAFFPFGIALAAAGAERALARRDAAIARLWTTGAFALVLVLTAGALVQWDAAFNTIARSRTAALAAIPPGPFMAIDAAAWRYLSGRPVIVTPAEFELGVCLAARYGASAIVLEGPHFREWDNVYVNEHSPMLGTPVVLDTIKIFPLSPNFGCSIGISR